MVITDGDRLFPVVVKRAHAPGAAVAEAAGLRWLAEARAVRVARVWGADEGWLVVRRVGAGVMDQRLGVEGRVGEGVADQRLGVEGRVGTDAVGRTGEGGAAQAGADSADQGPGVEERGGGGSGAPPMSASAREEAFGRDLARMHAAGAPAFGAAPPGGLTEAWIGTAPMRNVPGESWPEWYAEHRVLPYVRLAVDAGTLDAAADAAVFERACARIPALAGPPEPPARLHGDLWNGNVLWDAHGATLIDPAAHGGHRETDLAMLRLFGCPGLERIVAAYDEAAPLADGYRERIGLHQLFPLLVHTVLFGRSYAGQAMAAARSVG